MKPSSSECPVKVGHYVAGDKEYEHNDATCPACRPYYALPPHRALLICYSEGWCAQVLEWDYCSQGRTLTEAIRALEEMMQDQWHFDTLAGRDPTALKPAPESFHAAWTLAVRLADVSPDSTRQVRIYSDVPEKLEGVSDEALYDLRRL